MTAFFIPGITDGEPGVEHAYRRMRRQTELEMGRRPAPRRIFSLWTRRGALDCVTEVGRQDPLRDGTVIAIFDMGPHQPYIVWWQREPGSGEAMEVLGCMAYSVLEFEG
jgi:hypothetical protein